jgi:hypothetical protein
MTRLERIGSDIEHFSRHAKRSVAGMEDVRLCVRRNDDLVGHSMLFDHLV